MNRWYMSDEQPSWGAVIVWLGRAIVAQVRKWRLRALLLVFVAGCHPQFVLQMAPAETTVSAARVKWEQEATSEINDHEARIKALEARTNPTKEE